MQQSSSSHFPPPPDEADLAAAALFGYTQTELLDMQVHDLWLAGDVFHPVSMPWFRQPTCLPLS